MVAKNKTMSRSEMNNNAVLTAEEASFLAEPLSLSAIPTSSTYLSVTDTISVSEYESSGSLCCLPTTSTTVAVVPDEQTVSIV